MVIRKSQSPRPDQLWPEGVPHPASPPPPRANLQDFVSIAPASTRKVKARVVGRSQWEPNTSMDGCEVPPGDLAMFRVITDLNYEVGYLLGSLKGMRYLEPAEIKASITRVLEGHAKLEAKRHRMPTQ